MREWYRIAAQTDETVAELFVFDEIGKSFWSDNAVTAQKFVDDLKALPDVVKTIRVRVNSPGGSVFEAITIANVLRAQSRDQKRTVEMIIEGLAASAATIVTSAGDAIKFADNAMMMIHDPLAIVMGPAPDMRKMADLLDQVRDSIIATYRWTSQLSAKKLGDLMAETTWMNAEDAVKNGFATEVMAPVAVTAKFRPEALEHLGEIPADIREKLAAFAETKTTVTSLVTDAVKAGLKSGEFDALVAEHFSPKDKVDAKYVLTACEGLFPKLATQLLDQPKADVDARVAHAKEVRALCETAKMPELAEGYVLAHTPIATIKAHLTVVTAKLDKVEIDTRHGDEKDPTPRATRLTSAQIYEARRTIAKPLPIAQGAGRN
jgi:ATP-dependent Clp protease protease subunit